ncbi:hypothetical protein [Frankia sp. AiPa1]|uniref:hypothetical protein n=1 Tax=Frankia sp. AiPa1 TaxID=573492 RepID=UPI00202B64AE|nr:hypothetical protein [Frankia sp. AiPa1]MCL9760566.1 hypothetical protein [Frankia sp. AiPa1]
MPVVELAMAREACASLAAPGTAPPAGETARPARRRRREPGGEWLCRLGAAGGEADDEADAEAENEVLLDDDGDGSPDGVAGGMGGLTSSPRERG